MLVGVTNLSKKWPNYVGNWTQNFLVVQNRHIKPKKFKPSQEVKNGHHKINLFQKVTFFALFGPKS